VAILLLTDAGQWPYMAELVRGVNMNNRSLPKIVVRLPRDVKDWLAEQAAENASSQGSEIVRAVRERIARHQRDRPVPAEEFRESVAS
jgi:hypothetical protein